MSKQHIDAGRLSKVMAMELQAGGHIDMSDGMCVMEAVSFVAGEPWSDHPECASPVIATFLRNWNDSLPDDERTELLRELIPLMVGTRGSEELEQRRAMMAADWMIRVHTPAWLRLARLDKQAELLERLPEIADFAQCPSLMPALEAVRTDAAAACDAVWAAAWAAAWGAATAAAWDAAWAASMGAAWHPAWGAARDASRGAMRAAAATAAASGALADTKKQLQKSAVELVIRMINEDGEFMEVQ